MTLRSGTCKLCHSDGELRDSHYIPKGAYRLIQRETGLPPVLAKHDVIIRTSDQIKDHILCPTCEDRFSKNGEKWVLEYCHREGKGFKLKELIDAASPLCDNDGLKVYSASAIPDIKIDKLTYFVSSIMWRGSAHDWKLGENRISLGKYEEELRKYLLGEAGFPRNAAFQVSIIPDSQDWNLVMFPYGGRHQGSWQYRFLFMGILFIFFFGRIDANIRALCTFPVSKGPFGTVLVDSPILVDDKAIQHLALDSEQLLANSKIINLPELGGQRE